MAKGKVIENRKMWDSIKSEVDKFNNAAVGVGIHQGESSPELGSMVAVVAAAHEYGSSKRKIPERSFLRGWVAKNKAKIEQIMKKLVEKITGNEMKADQALGLLGQFGEDGVKDHIDKGPFVPNAPATIAKKGSSRPLIDTKQNLYNRIRWKIFHGGKVPE